MPRSSGPWPRFHDVVTMPVAERPGGMRVVITEDGPLRPLVDYFAVHTELSPSTERKVAAAVGFLYDFYRAAPPGSAEEQATFFERFVRALQRGTLRDDGTSDPPELYWPAGTRSRVREVVRYADAYCDHCALVSGAAPVNPLRPATFPERLRAMRALSTRNLHSLLAHLGRPRDAWAKAATVKAARAGRPLTFADVQPPHFPFAHTDRLLWEGFARRPDGPLHERYALRDLMVAVLQRFGGVRSSEPFHLFTDDVTPVVLDPHDPVRGTTARVRLYHPEEGRTAFRDPVSGVRRIDTRAAYLRDVWGRRPRNQMKHHPEYAGWKDLLLDDSTEVFAEVFWYPKAWGAVFWQLYQAYVRHVLPAGLDHPYLLVNLRGDGGVYGAPYKVDGYRDALHRAVRRVGLKPAKELGTTTHGLRHAYAQVLEKHGLSANTIQRALHHKSPASQGVYTRPSRADVVRELEAADRRALHPAPDDAALPVLPPARIPGMAS